MSDMVTSLKLEIEGGMLTIRCVCSTGWMSEEKEELWSNLDEVVERGW